MTFSNPWGFLALLGLIPVIGLHMLRPQRPRVAMPSTIWWTGEAPTASAARPWQPLRRSWLLLAQILLVILLAIALAGPGIPRAGAVAPHTVLIVDTSGSMAALDGSPSRLDSARQKALSTIEDAPPETRFSVVSAGVEPEVLVSTTADRDRVIAALDSLTTSAGAGDIAAALNLARSLETADLPIGFRLFTDGGLSPSQEAAIPAGTDVTVVGDRRTNRAISTLAIETSAGEQNARITVVNHGPEDVTQPVRVEVDDVLVARKELKLSGDSSRDIVIPIPPGERVRAVLESQDLLEADDVARAVGSTQPALKVLVAGLDDPFLTAVFQAMPALEVTYAENSKPADGYDLAIYNQVAVPARPGAPFLAIAPEGSTDIARAAGSIEAPVVTLVDGQDPVVAGLDLSDIVISQAQALEPAADARVVVGGIDAPLIVRGEQGDQPGLVMAMPLLSTTLPLDAVFPVLMSRMISDLGGVVAEPATLQVGDQLMVSSTAEKVSVSYPDGTTTVLNPDDPTPVVNEPGFWATTEGDRTLTFAVNAASIESDLTVHTPVVDVAPAAEAQKRDLISDQLKYVIAALLVLLLVEWFLARRRIGVGPKQWRWATALRAGLAGILLLALFVPTLTRPSNKIATVFLVDDSDSLGTPGRQAVQAWIDRALASSPGNERAVVAFGRDAQIERLPSSDVDSGAITVEVDRSGTDIESALRLGTALAPSDARRRVVLISDGRQTLNDATGVARQAAEQGVPIDVVVIDPRTDQGAATVGIDAPDRLELGETFPLRASIEAEKDGPATVRLYNGSEIVEERTVDLVAGANEVTFEVAADKLGASRFRVEVEADGDTQRENDAFSTVVQVTGAENVLLVEDKEGEADWLDAALSAGGIDVTVVDTADIPPLDELSGYASIVLVDVREASLSPDQVEALDTAVRQLGVGMMTVGGGSSYGVGGYLGSDLEKMLPVISDITDESRHQPVAQVFAIDTSESMGACHCAEGGTADNRLPRGATKTGIAAAAASDSIQAMYPSDEVGIVGFATSADWLLDLQAAPDVDAVTEALGTIKPLGNTNLVAGLNTAVEGVLESQAEIRHVVLFSDGFTEAVNYRVLESAARKALEKGVTVSVIGTGEGAFDELAQVANAGGGRYYPGANLTEIPSLMVKETMLASRNFIQEGEFYPTVTSRRAVVDDLSEAPPLTGYVGTTARPTAQTMLTVGEESDPLLATWRYGLGRVTSWTSDADGGWTTAWSAWQPSADLWTRMVRDTFPAVEQGGSIRTSFDGDDMVVSVERTEAWADGVPGTLSVTAPDGTVTEVPLQRSSARAYTARIPAPSQGIFAVGARIGNDTEDAIELTKAVSRSYGVEYRPEPADRAMLDRISALSGGRGQITPDQAFDRDGTSKGQKVWTLRPWLLLAAVLLWPIAVAVSRLRRRALVQGQPSAVGARADASPVRLVMVAVSGALRRVTSWRTRRSATPGEVTAARDVQTTASGAGGSDSGRNAEARGGPPSPKPPATGADEFRRQVADAVKDVPQEAAPKTVDSLLAAKKQRSADRGGK